MTHEELTEQYQEEVAEQGGLMEYADRLRLEILRLWSCISIVDPAQLSKLADWVADRSPPGHDISSHQIRVFAEALAMVMPPK